MAAQHGPKGRILLTVLFYGMVSENLINYNFLANVDIEKSQFVSLIPVLYDLF